MSANDNIKTIQTVYEAFGRGDVQAILDVVADDVDWAADGASDVPPWYGVRRSKADVAAFFQDIADSQDVEEFTLLSIAGNDTDVFALNRYRARIKATGKSVEMHLHHYFTLRDGKITYYRGSEDTAVTIAAFAP